MVYKEKGGVSLKIFNLICVRKTQIENEELILTNPLSEVNLPNLQRSFTFEIVFNFTDWTETEVNKLKVVIKDCEEQSIFDSGYLEVPQPSTEKSATLGFKLNDFEVQKYGQHTVEIIESDEILASTIFFINERDDQDGI
ncbi:hypothetical protein IGL98_002254 [Enterococcus sp. DIV0840]|uniref:hypothetical protein n=1 Tax=Enterococcus TaxID=1350 RepID=UPI001A8DFFBE|nr:MULTISPECIES: hypothetical protein [Enterococcus]MBO0433323.1 hypothetical protein [Enterococcus sp. DIV0849a]MBO0473484.1 hypothetical protein [Enterococcus ureasiticus]